MTCTTAAELPCRQRCARAHSRCRPASRVATTDGVASPHRCLKKGRTERSGRPPRVGYFASFERKPRRTQRSAGDLTFNSGPDAWCPLQELACRWRMRISDVRQLGPGLRRVVLLEADTLSAIMPASSPANAGASDLGRYSWFSWAPASAGERVDSQIGKTAFAAGESAHRLTRLDRHPATPNAVPSPPHPTDPNPKHSVGITSFDAPPPVGQHRAFNRRYPCA